MSTWLGRGGSSSARRSATLHNALSGDAATDAHHPHGTLLREITRDLHARLSDVTQSFDADEVKEVAVKLVVALESFRPKTNVNPGWPATLPAGRAASLTGIRNVRSVTRVAPSQPTPRRLSNFHQTMVRNESTFTIFSRPNIVPSFPQGRTYGVSRGAERRRISEGTVHRTT